MKKAEFMRKYGISIRSTTEDDRRKASTNEQRQSNYVIEFPDGCTYYSNSCSLVDLMKLVDTRGDNKKRLIIHHDYAKDSILIRVEPEAYGLEEEFLHVSESEAIRMYRYAYGLTGYHMQRVYV